jgi:hypothetical protein
MKNYRHLSGSHINTIYGIDFSGAEKVGTKIWITRGRILQDRLLIEDCYPVRKLKDAGNKRGDCLQGMASDPSRRIELYRTISKVYSGFVHGASPHIMEMYGGDPPHFHTKGMLGTPRIEEHADDLWNSMPEHSDY